MKGTTEIRNETRFWHLLGSSGGFYSYNRIDDDAYMQLGQALASLKNLRVLNLR